MTAQLHPIFRLILSFFLIFCSVENAIAKQPAVDWPTLQLWNLKTQAKSPLFYGDDSTRFYLIDFWASWCGPCQESLPFLNQLQKDFSAKGLVVVGVSLDEEKKEAENFQPLKKINYRTFLDESKTLKQKLNLPAIPYIYFVDRAGRVLAQHRGFKKGSAEEIRITVEKLLVRTK
jgi:thiol-disulfide isomerase/thioredoxin